MNTISNIFIKTPSLHFSTSTRQIIARHPHHTLSPLLHFYTAKINTSKKWYILQS